jgi:hypothetical protein
MGDFKIESVGHASPGNRDSVVRTSFNWGLGHPSRLRNIPGSSTDILGRDLIDFSSEAAISDYRPSRA